MICQHTANIVIVGHAVWQLHTITLTPCTGHHAGLGTAKDAVKGLQWLDLAYSAGHWRAPYAMALLHLRGAPGINADCEAAEHALWQFVAGSGSWPDDLKQAVSDLDAGRHWAALVQYLLLAEQGAEAATANAAWMLERGIGFSGQRAARLAARLFERCFGVCSTLQLDVWYISHVVAVTCAS